MKWYALVLRTDDEGLEEPVRRRPGGRQIYSWRDKVKYDMEKRVLVEEDPLIEGIGEDTSGN